MSSSDRDPLLDPPEGTPAWMPRIDDERSVHRLRWAVVVVLVLGIASFVVRGADRPADPVLAHPDPSGAPAGTAPGVPDRVPLEGFGEIAAVVTDADGATLGWCFLLAETPEQRQRGLMTVTDLGGYAGMVFVFQQDNQGGFWMRSTPMPLSIAYLDANGALVSTADMAPCEDSPDCPGYPAAGPYRFAIEVPQGRLDDIGIREGSTVAIGGECTPTDSG